MYHYIYHIAKSNRKDKKYCITTPEGKKINFGQRGASDYTIHKDELRKKRYIQRHMKNENWNDLTKAGTWSRYILWEKPTIPQAIRNMERIFNIDIVV